MSGLPWFKCYPRDFNDGMVGLTLEERGAYITILNVIYARGGPVPDDAGYFRALLCISPRQWVKIRAALIFKRKLFEVTFNAEPSLMNARAAGEIEENRKTSEKFSQAGKRGGQKSAARLNENNDLGQAYPQARLKPGSSDTDTDKSSVANATGLAVVSTTGAPPDDGAIWDMAVLVLTTQGKATPKAARSFFGRLLSEQKLLARDLLGPIAEAAANQTRDPQGFLRKAAQARGRRREEVTPPKRVSWV